MEPEDVNRWEDAAALIREMSGQESPGDLMRWTYRRLDDLERVRNTFFEALEESVDLERFFGYPRFLTIGDIRRAADMALHAREQYRGHEPLLRELLEAPYNARAARLEELLGELTPSFFHALVYAVDEVRQWSTREALTLCEQILDLVCLSDVRALWEEPVASLICGAARFAGRSGELAWWLLPENPGSGVPDGVILAALRLASDLAVQDGYSGVGLALVNVGFALSDRAIDPVWGFSRRAGIRISCYVLAVQILPLRRKPGAIAAARRLLELAESELAGQESSSTDAAQRLEYALAQASFHCVRGDLELAAGNAGEAIRHFRRSLQDREAALQRAAAEGVKEMPPGAMYGLPNSLSRLAAAEVKEWRLEEALAHNEAAVAEYRRLGETDLALAGHMEAQALIEFLRTEFDSAESLLAQAEQLRQDEEAE